MSGSISSDEKSFKQYKHSIISMLELTIHESFPLKDDEKYIDVVASVAKQVGGIHDISFGLPAVLEFDFYCLNKCDAPHIIAADAHYWVVSSLVVAKVLPGYGWKHVMGFLDTFRIDVKDPRVVVRIV